MKIKKALTATPQTPSKNNVFSEKPFYFFHALIIQSRFSPNCVMNVCFKTINRGEGGGVKKEYYCSFFSKFSIFKGGVFITKNTNPWILDILLLLKWFKELRTATNKILRMLKSPIYQRRRNVKNIFIPCS